MVDKCTVEDLNSLELKLDEIKAVLGYETLSRVLMDTIVSGDPKALKYTAYPALRLRVLFDDTYY